MRLPGAVLPYANCRAYQGVRTNVLDVMHDLHAVVCTCRERQGWCTTRIVKKCWPSLRVQFNLLLLLLGNGSLQLLLELSRTESSLHHLGHHTVTETPVRGYGAKLHKTTQARNF